MPTAASPQHVDLLSSEPLRLKGRIRYFLQAVAQSEQGRSRRHVVTSGTTSRSDGSSARLVISSFR
jgi:hypothetical protein